MIKLEIIEVDEYANYILKDNDGNTYDVNINFINMDKPKVGSIIYIQKSIIDENVSLNYGLIGENTIKNENELMMISYCNDKKYLERYYG